MENVFALFKVHIFTFIKLGAFSNQFVIQSISKCKRYHIQLEAIDVLQHFYSFLILKLDLEQQFSLPLDHAWKLVECRFCSQVTFTTNQKYFVPKYVSPIYFFNEMKYQRCYLQLISDPETKIVTQHCELNLMYY